MGGSSVLVSDTDNNCISMFTLKGWGGGGGVLDYQAPNEANVERSIYLVELLHRKLVVRNTYM